MIVEENLRLMAAAVRRHLSIADRQLILDAANAEPERFATLISSRAGARLTERDFAAFVLSCAKRVRAGGIA